MTNAERKHTYRPPIPEELKQEYEGQLSQVQRWKDGSISSDREESDLQHVNGMLLILEEMQERFPHMFNEINATTVAHMIYIHDAGEILAGDLSHLNPNYDSLRGPVKRRERLSFRLAIAKRIKNQPLRELTMNLYSRYVEKGKNDKEVQLTDLIDKIQASRFGLSHVFNGDDLTPAKRRTQLAHSFSVIVKPTEALIQALQSPYAKEEIRQFAKWELENFHTFGYRPAEIKPYFNKLSTLPSNST